MCCEDLKDKLGGSPNCYKYNSSVANGSQKRRFEVRRLSEHTGCCTISIDCLELPETEKKCDNVIAVCHQDKNTATPYTNHYFVDFKDNKSSNHPFEQIDATIEHFKKKGVVMHYGKTYAVVLTTTGVHKSLTLKKDVWVREFRKEHGTTPDVRSSQHTVQF